MGLNTRRSYGVPAYLARAICAAILVDIGKVKTG